MALMLDHLRFKDVKRQRKCTLFADTNDVILVHCLLLAGQVFCKKSIVKQSSGGWNGQSQVNNNNEGPSQYHIDKQRKEQTVDQKQSMRCTVMNVVLVVVKVLDETRDFRLSLVTNLHARAPLSL